MGCIHDKRQMSRCMKARRPRCMVARIQRKSRRSTSASLLQGVQVRLVRLKPECSLICSSCVQAFVSHVSNTAESSQQTSQEV